MSVKIVIVFMCAAIGTATGYAIMRSFKRNHQYLQELCGVLAELKNNVAYRRDGIAGALRGMNIKSAQLCKNVAEYIAFASGKEISPNISRGLLTADIHAAASEFFTALGCADGENPMDKLNMYDRKFNDMRAVAEQKSKKLGGLAVKLGFLIGLGVGILVL